MDKEFIELIELFQKRAFDNAKAKGFCDEKRNDGECLMLMVSELAEAMEALRNGNPPDNKLPQHSNFLVELSDVVIRILNYAGENDMRLGQAIVDKMKYNEGRPHKHGKLF